MSLGLLARVFASLSLVSIGGINAILPEIQRQVVDLHHWMSNPTFTSLFAIAHAAPGPNVILVSLIGWHVAGLAGLLVATVAVIGPSCTLAFIAARGIARWSDRRWLNLLKNGLVPVALGLIFASGVSMMRIADHGALTVAISVATAGFVVFTRRNPLWAMITGALLCVLAVHFGILR